ncbi:MAG: histidine kinase dimerization/phosphoacceptor domain -containing protein [Oceanicaulis sp.]
MIERQRVLADFGEYALRSDDLYDVLTEACRLVSRSLGTPMSKVVEIENGDGTARVVAGVGWPDQVVGRATMRLSERSSETFAIASGEPLITRDIRKETRFEFPEFMRNAGVVALVNVPIFLPGGRAFGLLQVDDREPREFDRVDIEFLRTYGSILGPVIDRLHKLHSLKQAMQRNETLMSELQHRVKNNLATMAALARIRQRRTDNETARLELGYVADRLDTLHLVHARLHESEDGDRLDLASYLTSLVDNLLEMNRDRFPDVRCEVQTDPVTSSSELATPLGLIVNEFITNSFKYAFTGRSGCVRLRLSRIDADSVRLELSDDGPGFDAADRKAGRPGGGMTLIDGLSEQIGASARWNGADGGARLTLEFRAR